MKGKRQAELGLAVVPMMAHAAIAMVMAAVAVAAAIVAAHEVVAIVPERVEISLDIAEE